MLRYLPNLLSLTRLLLVPVVLSLLLEGRPGPALAVFAAAAVLDALDGWIARHFDAGTVLGGYLDPLADKALLVGTMVTLGVIGWLPPWLVVLVVFRDVLIVGGAVLTVVMGHPLEMRPIGISKVNTAAQAVLAVVVMADRGLAWAWLDPLLTVALWTVVATTVASGAAYVYGWARRAFVD